MEIYRRTAYGSLLQTCLLLGIPLPNVDNSTLNEALSINPGATLGVGEMPRMRYLAIGIGGHRGRIGAGGRHIVENIQHEATDAGMYSIHPLALRPLDMDLTEEERERFALRRVEDINGVLHAGYYLRRLDTTNVVARLELRTVANNTTTPSPFVPTSENLAPTPPDIANDGTNVVTGQYVTASAPLSIVFDDFDATEILNASMILYGSEDYAFISEMAFVSGVDRAFTVTDPGSVTSFGFTDVVQAQIVTHVAAMQPMKTQRGGFTSTFDVGATEPLLTLVPGP